MTNWGYENNDDNTQAGNTPDGPKALRDAYDALKKQNEDLNSKLTSFLESQAKQQKASMFEALGVPGAADLYTGEADPEKAKAWIQSMQSVFGNAGGNPAPVVNSEPALSDAQKHQMQMMSQAGQGEAALGSFEAAQTGIGGANSIDDLLVAMKNLQGGV